MSSSMVLASDHTMSSSLNLGEDLHQTRTNDHLQTAAVTVRRSGTTNTNSRRKSTKAGNEGCKKKQPQRGMGVAQLERLRLQERWKKITQINSPIISTSSSPSTITTNLNDASFFAAETKPQFPKFPGFGNGVVAAAGFHGQGFVSDHHHHHHHDMLQGYLYGIGNMINFNGNSKELSSTPKVNNKCFTDHCAECHKKKRTYAGENLMFNEVNKYANAQPVAGCDFTGLNIGTVKGGAPSAGGGGDHELLEEKATFLHSMGFCNTDKEVEVVGVQKKKGSSRGSSSVGIPNNNAVVTEYEFFPGKGGYRSSIGLSSSFSTSPHHNELLMMKKLMGKSSSSSSSSESPAEVMMMTGGGGGNEASPNSSCFTTTSTAALTGGVSVDASTSIDLSLRLSY